MSNEAMAAVAAFSKSRRADRLVLFALANCANAEGWAWFRPVSIAQWANVSATTSVDIALANLEALGEILSLPQSSEGDMRLVRLTICLSGESVPNPQKKPVSTAKPLIPIPEDFWPSAAMLAEAAAKYPAMDVYEATEGWVEYYTANGKKFRDWNACWRNSLRYYANKGWYSTPKKAAEVAVRAHHAPQRGVSGQARPDNFEDAAAQQAARRRAAEVRRTGGFDATNSVCAEPMPDTEYEEAAR